MHCYVDESGNTGGNLFDKSQPEFMTAALITVDDFDSTYGDEIRRISQNIGESSIHANLLGPKKIELIARNLLGLLDKSQSRFFISSVNKSYLVTSKLVDTLFDSYENMAVPWHVYNFRPLRLLMVFKIGAILTEQIAKQFLKAILESNKQVAFQTFSQALSTLKQNVPMLPDARSRQLINEAIDWAQNNPENIYLHANSKAIRKGHLPNMVAFPSLLRGIDEISSYFNRPVTEIVHDRQFEFQDILVEWHDILSKAAPDVITLPGEEPFSLQCVANSTFRISSSNDSVGIQVIDVVLWIYKRFIEQRVLGTGCKELLHYVFRNGYKHALSFESVNQYLSKIFNRLDSTPITNDDIEHAKKTLAQSETQRQENLRQYALKKFQSRRRRDL